MPFDEKLQNTIARVERGGAAKYHQKNAAQGKLFARERLTRLLDAADGVARRSGDADLAARLRTARQFHERAIEIKKDVVEQYHADGTPKKAATR